MSGEYSTPDSDFDDIIGQSGMVDPGMAHVGWLVRSAEQNLNAQGGRGAYDYKRVIDRLNSEWPQHDVPAVVSGRLRLFGIVVDSDMYANLCEKWGEPSEDENGDKYWDVNELELFSKGIVDDSSDDSVRLAYAFSFNEDDHVPDVAVRHGEAAISYERLTSEGYEVYLKNAWPEIKNELELIIEQAGRDLNACLRMLDVFTREHNDELFAYGELCLAVSTYLTINMNFSSTAAYAVLMQGKCDFFDEDGEEHSLELTSETLEYVYRPVITLSNVNEKMEMYIVATSGDGGTEDETLLRIPRETVIDFRATFSELSLLDRALGSQQQEINEYIASEGGDINYVAEKVSARSERLGALRVKQQVILDIINRVRQELVDIECETAEGAKEAAESMIYSLKCMIDAADIKGLTLLVEGAVILPEMVDSTSNENYNLATNALANGDSRRGVYAGLYPAAWVNDERVVCPTILMRIATDVDEDETLTILDIPLREVACRSYAVVALDGTAEITIEDLHKEELFESAIIELEELEQPDVVISLEELYDSLARMSVSELDTNGIAALRNIATFCVTASHAVRKKVIDAVSVLLIDRYVALNTTSDTHELVSGTIIDVMYEHSDEFPPTGLVLILSGNDESIHKLDIGKVATFVGNGNEG